jgi:hypothetical protein
MIDINPHRSLGSLLWKNRAWKTRTALIRVVATATSTLPKADAEEPVLALTSVS